MPKQVNKQIIFFDRGYFVALAKKIGYHLA